MSTNKNDSKIQIDIKYLIDFEHTGSSIVQQSKSLENNINCNFMNAFGCKFDVLMAKKGCLQNYWFDFHCCQDTDNFKSILDNL